MNSKERALQNFFKTVRYAAECEGIEEHSVTAKIYESYADIVTTKDLVKYGGFRVLLKAHFPEDIVPDIVYGNRAIAREKNKLKKQYGEAVFTTEQLTKSLVAAVNTLDFKVYKAPPLKAVTKATRTLVACVSDTHFGANISKDEMGGANEYNWTIASRRMAALAEQIVSYKQQHRKETDLVIQLNGDIIAGLIHNQEGFVDLLTTQVAGTLDLLLQFISYCACHFSKVRVICTPGNHGRNMAKSDKGRATTNKWDSYETMIYVALRAALKAIKNIQLEIPECGFALYKVQGHNLLQTHGDTIINMSDPGTAINMKSIANQVNKFNANLETGKVSIVCVGHTHTPTTQLLENGACVVINGCLSGVDPYAQSIGIFGNHPTQIIFEATQKYPVGDLRMIQVKSADADKRFDSIIKPFTTKL